MTAKELRELRLTAGLTTRQLAQMLGVTRRAVNYWESGTRAVSPPVSQLVKLLLPRR